MDVLQFRVELQGGMGERYFGRFAVDGVLEFGDLLFRLRDETSDGGMDDRGVQCDRLQLFEGAGELGLLFAEACLEAVLLVELLLLFNDFFDGEKERVRSGLGLLRLEGEIVVGAEMLFEKFLQQCVMLQILFAEASGDGVACFVERQRQFGDFRLQRLFLFLRLLLEVIEFTLDFTSSGLFLQQLVLQFGGGGFRFGAVRRRLLFHFCMRGVRSFLFADGCT